MSAIVSLYQLLNNEQKKEHSLPQPKINTKAETVHTLTRRCDFLSFMKNVPVCVLYPTDRKIYLVWLDRMQLAAFVGGKACC